MKTYGFKKGGDWVESDYPPFDMAGKPRKRFLLLRKVAEWLFFLAGCYAACWAIYTALRTIYPGI